MLDVKKIRKDFPMFETNKTMQNHPMIYFDNAATTFKPQCVIDKVAEYYENYSTNTHRGDYDIAQKSDGEYEKARDIVAKFINADSKEVSFTSGASMSLNMIAYGYKKFLKAGDEVIISNAEHASNVLPWFRLEKEIGIKVVFVELDEEGKITIENFKKAFTPNTKVVSLAHVTNVMGYILDLKEMVKITHEHEAIFVCDGAQSVPHMKIDVKDLDIDFLAFSGHKMCGPTGIGVLYGKYDLLLKIDAIMLGGGMNTDFNLCGDYGYLYPPHKFEAGTQNVAGALGLAKAIEYIDSIGIDNIHKYEMELKEYAVSKLKDISEITLYNQNSESAIVTFNYKGVHAQDMGTLLAANGICVRSGQHCAKLLHNTIGIESTVRASMYFYNTKEEIDAFVEACKKGCDFLDVFFA